MKLFFTRVTEAVAGGCRYLILNSIPGTIVSTWCHVRTGTTSRRVVGKCLTGGGKPTRNYFRTILELLYQPKHQEYHADHGNDVSRSEEHTSELQSLMRNPYAVFCLTQKNKSIHKHH